MLQAAWLRFLRRGAYALPIAYAAYLVIGNLLLNSPLGGWAANLRPEKFRASWGTALTMWPGQLRVTELRMAGHLRHTVWSVQADAASGYVALWPLFYREVRVPRLQTAGVSGGASLIDVARNPPAPRPGGWTIRVERVEADSVRYASFNDLVLQGSGHGHGGFVKQFRGGPMEVLPSDIEFESASLWRDGHALLREASVAAKVAIASHRRAEAPGVRKLLKTDATVSVDGVTSGVGVVVRQGNLPEFRSVTRPGHVQGTLSWSRGSLVRGGALRLQVPVDSDIEGARPLSAMADLAIDVDADDIRLRASLAPQARQILSADADLVIQGRTIPLQDFATLVPRTSGHLVSQWHFTSLRWLDAFIGGSRIVSFDGAGTVLADLRLASGELVSGSSLRVPHVSAAANALGSRFTGEARAVIRFEQAKSKQLRTQMDAVMEQFGIAPADAPGTPYVTGRNLEIQMQAEGELKELRDRYRAQLRFSDAVVPDLRVYNRYLPKGQVRLDGGSGLVSGDLAIDGEGAVGEGSVRVVGRQARIHLAGIDLQGDFDVNTRLHRAELRSRAFVVDGSTVALKNIRTSEPGFAIEDGWWANLDLQRARLDWDRPFSLDGRISARMKDISLLLALFARKKDFPTWIDKVLDEGEASVQARVQLKNETLVLDGIEGHNDRFEILARLRSRDGHRVGALFARSGLLSVGVELDGTRKDYHLVQARKWFDAQPSLLLH